MLRPIFVRLSVHGQFSNDFPHTAAIPGREERAEEEI